MGPEKFRKRWGFVPIQAASLSLISAVPALAAPVEAAQTATTAPIAIAVGALGFGLLASYFVRRMRRKSADIADRAYQQMAEMQVELDIATGVLDGLNELTIVWRDAEVAPGVYGQTDILFNGNHETEAVTDLRKWLTPSDGALLARHISRLKTQGTSFDTNLVSLEGRLMRISGRILGGAAVMRIRPATSQPDTQIQAQETDALASALNTEMMFGLMDSPAWTRDENGVLKYANASYWAMAEKMNRRGQSGETPEIFGAKELSKQLKTLQNASDPHVFEHVLEAQGAFDLVLFSIEDGTAGFLRKRAGDTQGNQHLVAAEFGNSAGIINAIATPIAIFDGDRKLRHFNDAYCAFWDLDPDWLTSGVDETAILDRLRTQGLLPSEADYRAWRKKHLESYDLQDEREEPWYLPDGRTLNVVSVPAAANDGVIYIFEDITERLALESRYNAMIDVQSETLSALSEGVAVFGTNGRLTLHNPRLSVLWKLPMNELGRNPHIDQISDVCAAAMPEDGATIWRDLKQNVVDLNPSRTDRSARINRADGRLIDYAVTRLPDGQTMMTFVDVTESANYQRVLKERNDALVAADRLKDAFVQNVSYELRSPLTNIIGFADLLSSGAAGDLNDKQRSYTKYIRASSETLGVLIDNILDLATADAGVAELLLEPQNIEALVERARAGLAGTLTAGGSEELPNLAVHIDRDLPEFVADGTRVVQVLYNLLANASRFSTPGSEVSLNVSSQAERIIFTIEDEGVGVTDEMKSAMAERFDSGASDGRQRRIGLGLAIVKTFVNLHGGTVQIEERSPIGTRVVVSIPANQDKAVISAAE